MLASFFVERPIFAWVIFFFIVIAGGVCFFTLPIAQYPPIVPPNIQVAAVYPGASAVTLANTVAQPIEEQVNGVPGMIYMSSSCTNNGYYNLNVTFDLGTDINVALMLVQTRVQLALSQLPTPVQKEGLTVRQQSPNILLAVNLISPDQRYDVLYLSNYAQINIYDELSRLPGVALVNFLGQRQYSMRAWLDPQKMASLDLTASDVINAIQEQNVEVAAGNIGQQPVPKGQDFQLVLNALGRLESPKQFEQIVIKVGQGGRIVYLRDVARLELGPQNSDLDCVLTRKEEDGTIKRFPSIGLAVYTLPQANALDVGGKVKELMERLKKDFPEGVDYQIGYDTTPFIKHSIEDVLNTLIIAAILVVVVILVFLQDWHAMLLPIIDVVCSLVGTFAIMAALGFSLNNLSLFGLVLAIGILVDDSIVVVENIERWMGTGIPAKEATIKAMTEITGPVIGITLVLSSVFIPAAFIPGLTGEFFRQFALTIAASTIISATNAMTMAPARAASWIKPHKHGETREALPWFGLAALGGFLAYRYLLPLVLPLFDGEASLSKYGIWGLRMGVVIVGVIVGGLAAKPINWVLGLFFAVFNKVFDFSTNVYTRIIGVLLRLSAIVLLIYVGLLGLTYYGFMKWPKGFIPQQDQGYLLCQVELPDSYSVQQTSAVLEKMSRIATKADGVRYTLAVGGFSALYQCDSSNWGNMWIILEDFSRRKTPETQAAYLIQKFNKEFYEQIPEAQITVFGAPPVPGLGQSGGFQLQIEDVRGRGLDALQEATQVIVEQAEKQPGIAKVFTSFRNNTPQLYVDIDREMAKQMNVTLSDVFQTLTANMGSVYINQFNVFGRVWQVNIQAEGKYRVDPDQLRLLYVKNKQGQPVPLGSLINVRYDSGPTFVMRYNDLNSTAINGFSYPTMSSGQAIALMEELCAKNLPQGMGYEWTNIAYQEIKAGNTGILVFGLGILFVFLVLAALYESWGLPAAIILVVPMCLLCSVAGIAIAKKPMDIFVQIGFTVLIGLAAKNAILIVAYAKDKQAEGMTLKPATLEACKLRLRPILMTSFAFIMGVYPLMIATGAGWEMRRALGTAVFSGMLGVTFFGIFLTPVFFYVIRWLGSRKGPAAEPPGAPR